MVPDKAVTMLSGDGGVGKSLLAKQLGVAVATGGDWIGLLPEAGAVLYVSAEDDEDEIHRRLADVAAGHGLGFEDLADFHVLSLAGQDAVMGAPDRSGLVSATPLWRALVDQVELIGPRLLILDNLADVFAGNENSRPEARQFIGLLRAVAIEHALAVLLVAHPSLTGLASGSGTSGSTAWSNSVRSRLYLDRAGDGAERDGDPDLRVLRTMKANYAAIGGEIKLRWESGCLRREGYVGGYDRATVEAEADRQFLDILAQFTRQGRDVSPSPSSSFAPTVFAAQPGNGGLSRKAFTLAMNRLFAVGKIKVEKFGPPSKQRSRIVAGVV